MGLFDFIKRRWNPGKRNRRTKNPSETRKILQRLTSDIENIRSQFKSTELIVQRHDKDIAEHTTLIGKHTGTLAKLEELVAKLPTSPVNKPDLSVVGRPDISPAPVDCLTQSDAQKDSKFDLANFSQQEKKILSVFFQNPNMALSYVDIARSLGKASNTIKNQMHQIGMKSDIFKHATDNQSRKRFRLKDGLKIERYINVSAKTDQVVSPVD